MNKKKTVLLILSASALFLATLLLIIAQTSIFHNRFPQSQTVKSDTPVMESGSESKEDNFTQQDASASFGESEKDVELEIDPETNEESPYISYADSCALNYVATPVVYSTRAEVLARINELSAEFPEMATIYNNEALYSDNIILSLANNPEMLDYVLGYTISDGSVTGGFTPQELEEKYPLFLQWDVRWGYMSYGSSGTLGTSGCGPAALSMAIFYLTRNPEITPDAIAAYSLKNGYYVQNVGTSWSLLDDYPKQYGLNTSRISLSEAGLKTELDKGNILICSVSQGDFTYGGHFIVIYDYDENGFKINDPKCVYRSRLTWTYETIQDDIRQVWSVEKLQ